MEKKEKWYVLVAVNSEGKAMGAWDGRFVNKKVIEFYTAHEAAVELNNYRDRFLHRYPEEWKVVRAEMNLDWDALNITTRSRNNPLRKRKTIKVGQPG